MFSSKVKIKIDKGLYDRLAEAAQRAGYAAVDEMITHALEREVSNLEETSSEKEVEQQLRGLGYIE